MRKGSTVEHEFYCVKCGNGYPLARRKSKQKEKFHRKKLYCPWCREEINFIECKTPAEVYEFKDNFNKGVYEDEKQESLCFVRSAGMR